MKTFSTFDPFQQKPLKNYSFYTFDQVQTEIQKLAHTQKQWEKTNLSEREDVLAQIATSVEKEKRKWALMAAEEMGKPISQGVAEVEKCVRALREIPKLRLQNSQNSVRAEAHGVVLSLQPWNYPFWQVLRMATTAWFTGHTVLLKHSEIVAGCAELIEDVCQWHGQKLLIQARLEPEVIHRLIEEDPRLGFVTFTGSTKVGRLVAETCGRALKPGVFELGGNDAYIVEADADLDLAAQLCAQTRLLNSGQSCISGKRFYLHKKIKKSFLELFVQQLKRVKRGDPKLDETTHGPLASPHFLHAVRAQKQKVQATGVDFLEVWPDEKGFSSIGYFDFGSDLRAFEADEFFAPLALVYDYDSLERVIESLNLGPYGLAGGVFTQNKDVARGLAKSLKLGTFSWNDFTQSDPLLPFGGTKQSGFGREMGLEGLQNFVSWKVLRGF